MSRILNGQSTYKAAKDFYRKLLLTNFLQLTREEMDVLEQSLEISRIGTDAFLSLRKLKNLLLTQRPSLSDDMPLIPFNAAWQPDSLQKLLQTIKGSGSIRGILFNCCGSEALVTFLSELLNSDNAERVEIHHYFEIGNNATEATDALLCLTRLAHFRGYSAYCRVLSNDGRTSGFPLYKNLLRLWVGREDGGEDLYSLFLPDDERIYANIYRNASILFDEFLKTARIHSAEYISVKKPDYDENQKEEGLLQLSRRMLFLEKDRILRQVQHSIRVNWIPPDIFSAFVQNAAEALGFDPNGELAREHLRVQAERFDNAFRKKKPSFILLEKGALRCFAETGMIEGLAPGVPPLSAAQRERVLDHLLDAAKNNVHVHLSVSREETLIRHLDILCIDGLGVCIFDVGVDYSFPHKSFEALLPVAVLADVFARFFDGELLAEQALSDEESIGFLASLKHQIRKQEAAEAQHREMPR